jgi:hypothetical protein
MNMKRCLMRVNEFSSLLSNRKLVLPAVNRDGNKQRSTVLILCC